MSLYEQWKKLAEQPRSQQEYEAFWADYFQKEKDNYSKILENKKSIISGKLSDAANEYGMSPVEFTGFIDGINTSLETQVDLESLIEDSEIELKIVFENLYYNMIDAKADWLYNLPEWDNILTIEQRKEIRKKYNEDHIAVRTKVGRNDPCVCGSGKKYKKCCGA